MALADIPKTTIKALMYDVLLMVTEVLDGNLDLCLLTPYQCPFHCLLDLRDIMYAVAKD